MSEEIMIDGVNVAECRCFIENTAPNVDGDEFLEVCENVYTESSYCENNKDCYYKQLNRLQAENEELKEQLEFSRTHKAVLDAERIKYKQALEEIRKIAKIAFIVCDDECGNANKFAEIQDKINEVLK